MATIDYSKLISNLVVTHFILKNDMTRNPEKLKGIILLKQKYFPHVH